MQLTFITILTLLSSALTAPTTTTSPQFLILQSKVTPGQTDKGAFDNLYLTIQTVGTTNYAIFNKLNEDAVIFYLNPTTAAKGSQPALNNVVYNGTSYEPRTSFLLAMNFNSTFDALWQTVTFQSLLSPLKAGSFDDRFYVNTTNGSSQLLWSNNITSEAFKSWLVCNYNLGFPQLLFYVKYTDNFGVNQHPSIPSSCALIDLEVIPIPDGKGR